MFISLLPSHHAKAPAALRRAQATSRMRSTAERSEAARASARVLDVAEHGGTMGNAERMNDRDQRLRQFFSGYFHQDWEVEGAKSWRDVVARYVRENTRAHVLAVQSDLRSWLAETAAYPAAVLPGAFGCEYNPLWAEGLREREWVESLAELLGKMVTN